MELLKIKVQPDIEKLLDVVQHRSSAERVHHVELFLDEEIKNQIRDRFSLAEDINPNDPFAELKRDIELHSFLGYDAFRLGLRTSDIFNLPHLRAADTTEISGQSRGLRDWSDEHAGPIQSWQDFESYSFFS